MIHFTLRLEPVPNHGMLIHQADNFVSARRSWALVGSARAFDAGY